MTASARLSWPTWCRICRTVGGCSDRCGRQETENVPAAEIRTLVRIMEQEPTSSGLTQRQHLAAALLRATLEMEE